MNSSKWWYAALALAVACTDSGGVDSDAIASAERTAVQGALNNALANDSLYPTLALLVFPYIDRASHLVNGTDTTRIVGIQLDIDVEVAVDTPAPDTVPLQAQMSVVLAWSGYDPVAHTVDTVIFVIGQGANTLPVNDSLRERFSPDTVGTGTAIVAHQTGPGAYLVWLARQGALHVTSANYGAALNQPFGTLTLAVSRGTIAGDFHTTAKLVPDSATTVTTDRTFSGGIQGLKIRITGLLP